MKWIVLGLTIIGSILASVAAVLYVLGGSLTEVLPVLPVFTVGSFGTLIISKRPANRIGWVLLTGSWVLAVAAFGDAYARYSAYRSLLPLEVWGWWIGSWVFTAGYLVIIVGIALIFPTGRFLSSRWRWIALAVTGIWAQFVLIEAVKPGPVPDNGSAENPVGIALVTTLDERVGMVWDVSYVFALFATLAALILRVKHSRGIERQQVKWLVWTIVAAVIVQVSGETIIASSHELGSALRFLAFAILTVGLPSAIAIALLRYDLYDIDLIINRTIVYLVLTIGVVGSYIGLVGYLGAVVLSGGDLTISLLATGLIALLFQPLRERLQRGVNRLMYGERDEPYAVLTRLGQRLEGSVTSDAVLPTIAATVREALKSPYAAITLRNGDTLVTAAAVGAPSGSLIHLPLIYQQEAIGELVLAPRAAGETFGPRDERLLGDLARQIGVVAHNVRLTEQALRLNADLQRSREQLVTAREEERRRLRRDLHDGIGPALASMGLQVEAARDLLTPNPEEATMILDGVIGQLQSATNEIRQLVYALRPPALDDLGLVGALRTYVARYQHGPLRVTIVAPDAMPPLSAAVEAAIYRIATEAITNVIRHAHATTCRVALTVDEARDQVQVSVCDDGIGLAEPVEVGVGLRSMRERAVELGGALTIRSGVDGGTQVVARLPLLPSQERSSDINLDPGLGMQGP